MAWLARIAVFALAFAGFLLAWAPLAAALSFAGVAERGVAFTDVRGTIWNGRVEGLRVAGRPVGDVEMRLDPMGLLGLSLRAQVETVGVVRARGAVALDMARVLSASDASLRVDARYLDALHPALAGRDGDFFLRLDEFAVDAQGACLRAQGRAETDILTHPVRAGDWAGPPLEGPVTCEAGAMIVALGGENADGRVSLRARLEAGTGASLVIRVEEPSAQARLALPHLDFSDDGDALVYAREMSLSRE